MLILVLLNEKFRCNGHFVCYFWVVCLYRTFRVLVTAECFAGSLGMHP